MFSHYNTRPAAESFLEAHGFLETAIGLWTGPRGQRAAVTPFCGDVVRIEVLA
jgi:hypothetical protein